VLPGRNLIVYHSERTTQGTSNRAYPQRGILSPLLWCLVVNDLLEDLQQQNFHVYGSADDIAIVAGGHSLTTLRDLMEHALNMTYR
jgi:hypothetical protein